MTTYELKQDFGAEVLDASMTAPVVVDFWAQWCGPCRVLSPILEKMAAAAKGAWTLVTVDTDTWQELAQIFRIQSLPTVMLFDQGKPISQFQGALPEDQIQAWLKKYLPAQEGGSLELAEAAFDNYSYDDARQLLLHVLAKEPENQKAQLLMARTLFFFDPDAAVDAAEKIKEDDEEHYLAAELRRLRDLTHWGAGTLDARTPSGDPSRVARYKEAAVALAEGDFEAALEIWVELVGVDRKLDDDGARLAAAALFHVLGGEHVLTQEYRRKLTMLLY